MSRRRKRRKNILVMIMVIIMIWMMRESRFTGVITKNLTLTSDRDHRAVRTVVQC